MGAECNNNQSVWNYSGMSVEHGVQRGDRERMLMHNKNANNIPEGISNCSIVNWIFKMKYMILAY